MRLPSCAGQQRRPAAVDTGDALHRGGIARRDAVPPAPHVLPALDAGAVEEGRLQDVVPVRGPAVAHMHHVAWLQPLPLADQRHEWHLPVAPAQRVEGQHGVVLQRQLGLQRQRHAKGLRGAQEIGRHAGHGVAIDTVSADCRQKLDGGLGLAAAFVPRADVPWHGRKEHAHALALEVLHHAFHAGHAAGHVAQQVPLVAVVHPTVRVHRPQQHAVDAAIALAQVIEQPLHGVDALDRVVQQTVLHHHLRLHEAALCPLQLRAAVLCVVVAQALVLLAAPALHGLQPGGVRGRGVAPPIVHAGQPVGLAAVVLVGACHLRAAHADRDAVVDGTTRPGRSGAEPAKAQGHRAECGRCDGCQADGTALRRRG
mmetsp:Transcript_41611/g.97737  ORF Transcript_41611/g.97737 Transcript_41611/m.97737 type:complete len:370 (-) Transcript_41611:7873-8982(-)